MDTFKTKYFGGLLSDNNSKMLIFEKHFWSGILNGFSMSGEFYNLSIVSYNLLNAIVFEKVFGFASI